LFSRASSPSRRAISAIRTICSIRWSGFSDLWNIAPLTASTIDSTRFKGKPIRATVMAPPRTIMIAGGSMKLARFRLPSPWLPMKNIVPPMASTQKQNPRIVEMSIARSLCSRKLALRDAARGAPKRHSR